MQPNPEPPIPTVDLWLWPLTPPCPPHLAALLSPEEAARADRFARPGLGDQFRIGRGRLRQVLGAATGTDPATLDLLYGAHGKPWLPGGPGFNLSHSGGWAALAVSRMHPPPALGLDIEAHRPVEPVVAHRFFSPRENADLAALPPALWSEGFFRCWTRKEAVVKAVGDGLSIPLDGFDVTLTPDAPARITRLAPGLGRLTDWHLSHLDLGSTPVPGTVSDHGSTQGVGPKSDQRPGPGFSGALAVRGGGAPRIRLRGCPPD